MGLKQPETGILPMWWREPSVQDLRLQFLASLMEVGNSRFTGLCSAVWYRLIARWAQTSCKGEQRWSDADTKHDVFIVRLAIQKGWVAWWNAASNTGPQRAQKKTVVQQKNTSRLRLCISFSILASLKTKQIILKHFQMFQMFPLHLVCTKVIKELQMFPILC